MTAKKTKRRPRGGAAVPCPACGEASFVLKTSRDGTSVRRKRMCRVKRCGTAFMTEERVLGETSEHRSKR